MFKTEVKILLVSGFIGSVGLTIAKRWGKMLNEIQRFQ